MTSIHSAARACNSEPARPTTDRSSHRHQPARPPVNGPLSNARFRRQVAHLHALGVRPTAELLIEHVGDDEQACNTLLLLLDKYSRLSPAVVEAVGGDVFPPVPIHEVQG